MKTYEVVTRETVVRWYRLKLPDESAFSAAVEALETDHDHEPDKEQCNGEEVSQVDAVDGSTFSGARRRRT